MPPAPTNAYLRTQVLTAGPAELRLMLFDGAIRFAEQAREALTASDFETAYHGFTKTQDIVMELINGLRSQHNPELCEQLSALYTFIYQRLVSASSERNVELVDEALHLLRYERETWAMLLEKLAAENRRAGSIAEMPEATEPINEADHPPPTGLVGGRVSIRG